MLFSRLLLLFLPFSYQIFLDDFSNPHWGNQAKELCAKERYGVPNMNCYLYRIYLFPVKVEVRSTHPPLIVLKHFIPKDYIRHFLSEINENDLQEQGVVDATTGRKTPSLERMANGTRMKHHETSSSSKIFNLIQQRVVAIDFRRAENYSVLSYNPGGHYAPHFDYIPFTNEEEKEKSEMGQKYGNRFLTFLFILQTAKKGGGTVFPLLFSTVQPEKGDALMWLNMDTSYAVESRSLHAACPILEGKKIAVTLWVRRMGQELLLPCHQTGIYDLNALIHPSEKKLLLKRN